MHAHTRTRTHTHTHTSAGICLLYTVIYGPYTLAFFWYSELCSGTPYDECDMIVEIVFLAEIFFTCFVGRYKEFRYLGNLQDIAGDYLGSGQLSFDLFTSIPGRFCLYIRSLFLL